ncbi:asparagine synthase-related protein [Alteribacter natronophilus]|uniref:asparagine synthase-related protein n=1 Tax=Alteribacter natronophilus TaxID=2583810 RepID=UPI00110EFB4D|nr:asparagine synthase-related protein [Alteribacter natronophilus]TMW70536.1 asparagine synthetase B [Alteribacter natronophilus]
MSAIYGMFHLDRQPGPPEYIEKMAGSFPSIPVDNVQVWKNENVFLGCHQQWITSESVQEQNPYYDSERQLAVAADAILDNREVLFSLLNVPKHRRKTITDTELILLSYAKWNDRCPDYLLGDFAFVIWDEKEQKLIGARDPSGYRTLYYMFKNGIFAFATTAWAILSLPIIKKELNEEWLAENLTLVNMNDTLDAKATPYKGIEQIQPFHTISLKDGNLFSDKYGSFEPKKQLKLKTNDEYIEAFQDVFEKSVRSKMRTRGKVGSQLSGGLDSGSVVGFASKLSKEPLTTLSYVPVSDYHLETPGYLVPNEKANIKKIVTFAGNIEDHYFDFKGKSSYSEIDDFLNVMEMPYKFHENSYWIKGMFEEAEKLDLKVLLNGDKGNFTISWGAAHFYYSTLLKKFKWIRLAKELDAYSKNAGGSRYTTVPYLVKTGFPSLFNKGTKENPLTIVKRQFSRQFKMDEKCRSFGFEADGWFQSRDPRKLRSALFTRLHPWNTGNALSTKLSLRHGVWKRDPTNDRRVVEFCLSLPHEQYVQGGMGRALVRRATKGILPDAIRLDQTTRGQQSADWLHRIEADMPAIRREVQSLIDSPFADYFHTETLKEVITGGTAQRATAMRIHAPECRILLRALIVYRFLRTFDRKEVGI